MHPERQAEPSRAAPVDQRAPVVLTIGNFDGVHLGHASLVRAARRIAQSHGAVSGARPVVAAMVLYPHPATALAPARAPAEIMRLERREEALRSLGVDEVIRQAPTAEFLGRSPEAFAFSLCADRRVVAVVEGPDFRFGKGRAGDVATLAALGAIHGFAVEVGAPVTCALSDGSTAPVSSTLIRWLLERGRVRDAAACMGRPHALRGRVTPGSKRGRELGWPTANLDSPGLAPADGVYSAIAVLPDGARHAAAVSVGTNPQFDGETRTVEAHLIGWRGVLDDYGWELELGLVSWLRDQARFETVAALVDQIRRDCERSADVVAAEGVDAMHEFGAGNDLVAGERGARPASERRTDARTMIGAEIRA